MKKKRTTETLLCFKRWSRKGYSSFASMHRLVTIGVLTVNMSIISLSASTKTSPSSADSLIMRNDMELDSVQVVHKRSNPTRSEMVATPIYNRSTEVAAPIQTLESALRQSTSIDVKERGAKGMQADISIRGGSFDQTQVMLNGINFTDARTGHQTHSLPIDIESVAGIELIDGVMGVGAYAGAINIRTAPLYDNYLRVDMGGGQYGYGYANLSGAVTKERLNIYTALSYKRSDGYTYNTDFENYNAFIRATYDSKKIGFFDVQAGYQHRAFGSNGFYSITNQDQYETTSTALTSVRWVKSIGALELNASGSYRKNFDHYEWKKENPTYDNYHNTDNVTAEIFANYKWSAGVSTIGVDYGYNHIWSTNLGIEQSEPNGKYDCEDDRTTVNSYLKHSKEWGKFTASGSVGVSTTTYGTTPMWSISGRYKPADGVVIELGANESMRLPTFTDLYYSSAVNIPDPNLEPERAITYRALGSFTRGKWATSATLYLRDGSNIIDWTQAPGESVYYSRQITELTTYGAEWMGSYSPKCFVERITINYGYTTQDKSSGDLISLYAQNYMQNKLTASLTLRLHPQITVVVNGSFYDRMGNYTNADGEVVAFKPYALLDGRIVWERRGVKIYFDATNITSTEYFDYGGLVMPSVWASAGITLTIK
ncbi:MAG: TonB-dependent receptor [Rikenellaceae bacterium]